VAKANRKKRFRRNVQAGIAFINATFNNTQVTITDTKGDTLCWASAGTCGFKGSRKSTPFAGQCASQQAAEKAVKFGQRSRKCDYGTANRRHHDQNNRRCDADPPQWMSSS
jgi:small subunit ribosomal protein S11